MIEPTKFSCARPRIVCGRTRSIFARRVRSHGRSGGAFIEGGGRVFFELTEARTDLGCNRTRTLKIGRRVVAEESNGLEVGHRKATMLILGSRRSASVARRHSTGVDLDNDAVSVSSRYFSLLSMGDEVGDLENRTGRSQIIRH